MDTVLFLLATSSSIWLSALAWIATGRAQFRYKLAAVAGAILLSGPLGFVLVMSAIEADSGTRNPGAGVAAIPHVLVWAFMALACLAVMIAYFAKRFLRRRTH